MFIDEVTIRVQSGKGGNGCVAFRREKFVPRGGPAGGDGGKGGDVILRSDPNHNTLLHFRYNPEHKATPGRAGEGSNKTGKSAEHLYIPVPPGTVVYDGETGEKLFDFDAAGHQEYVAAHGGHGGKGNARFATSTNQAPRHAEPGEPGEDRRLRLELKLLADVGLVGFPNAGKSTLLRRISAARPRVAAYPFTTLFPVLGVAEQGYRRFVIADIPGLIEGASDGVGLGDRFLRHVERTRVLVHLIDAGTALLEERDPCASYDTVRKELGSYEPALLERREIVVLNKIDLVADREALDAAEAALRERGCEVLRVSGATGEGSEALVAAIARAVDEAEAAA